MWIRWGTGCLRCPTSPGISARRKRLHRLLSNPSRWPVGYGGTLFVDSPATVSAVRVVKDQETSSLQRKWLPGGLHRLLLEDPTAALGLGIVVLPRIAQSCACQQDNTTARVPDAFTCPQSFVWSISPAGRVHRLRATGRYREQREREIPPPSLPSTLKLSHVWRHTLEICGAAGQ